MDTWLYMLRRLGWLIGLNNRGGQVKKLPDAKPHPAKVQPVVMLDTVQEIAIYIHRFHNLDLFHQGYEAFFFFPVYFDLCISSFLCFLRA